MPTRRSLTLNREDSSIPAPGANYYWRPRYTSCKSQKNDLHLLFEFDAWLCNMCEVFGVIIKSLRDPKGEIHMCCIQGGKPNVARGCEVEFIDDNASLFHDVLNE